MPERFLHRLGAGTILVAYISVSIDSYVSRDSLIEGASYISYGSVIKESAIKDSHVSFANISKSALVGSHVAGAIISDSGFDDVVVRGTKTHRAVVRDCLLSNQVVIEGCQVRRFELSGPYLIHADFNRAPRHYLLEPAPGVQMGLSECTNGRLHCGCECRTYNHWLVKKELLRKIFDRRGWAPDSVDIIHSLFDEWRRVRLAA